MCQPGFSGGRGISPNVALSHLILIVLVCIRHLAAAIEGSFCLAASV